jgi:hypothetical protein
LLPPPSYLPTESSPLFVQSEPAPVTSALLLAEGDQAPIQPLSFATVPPLEMTRLLPLP